mmetsp:Transcript_15538/g.22766  ORF Transcript_15538/g.22766 Transcript_15538/m.22766 type:complete len:244 (+) Transcript_15538:80-811(+)
MLKASAIILSLLPLSQAFSLIQPHAHSHPSWALHAKKKSNKSRSKGFGKKTAAAPKSASTAVQDKTDFSNAGFASIEEPTVESFSKPRIDIDPDLPTQDRTKAILKQKYGLRSYEEQQGDILAAEKMVENKQRMDKIKQMKDDEFDIFMIIPPPIITAIDAFLKGGLTITTVLFVLAGFGITAEAWAVATGNVLPESVDSFIVNVIEPNFTPGLLVLLGFSICLGIFATAQLGSASSTYKEQP